MGGQRRASLADLRRHRRPLGQRDGHPGSAGGPRGVRGAGPLERPPHARGRERRHDRRGVPPAPLAWGHPRRERDVEVWVRELNGGARAVVLLNRGESAARAEVTWDLLGGSRADTALVRDLWERQDIGPRREGYDRTLAPHSAAMLRATRDNSARA